MFKKMISILIVVSILATGVITSVFSDTPLTQRITDEESKVRALTAERDKFSQQCNRLNNSIMDIGNLRLRLNNAAINRTVVLSTRLFVDAITAITTELLDLGINLAEELVGVDEWFQIETNEQHGDAYVRANKMAEACTSLISYCENKRNELLGKIDEKQRQIEASKTEIKRLKELYKQATGDEYISNFDSGYAENVGIKLEQNLGGNQPSEGTFDLAYDAAYSVYSRLKLEPGWGMSEPILVYSGDNNPLLAFKAYVSGPDWDGTYESYSQQDFSYSPYEYWVYVKQAANGKYSLMNSDIIHLPEPKITTNEAALDFERGKAMELQANVECFDGNAPLKVAWFVEEGDTRQKIGEGEKLSWNIPDNIGAFRVAVIAEDSLHGVSLYYIPRYIYPSYYSFRGEDNELKCTPAVPEIGDTVTATVDLWFINPCDVEVDWRVPGTIGGVNPALDMNNASTTTTGAYRVGRVLSPAGELVYVYRANIELQLNFFDTLEKPLYHAYVYYTVHSKTGSVERDNYENSIMIRLGTKHISQYENQQKELGKQEAEQLLVEYNKKLEKYKSESELFLKVDSNKLTDMLHSINVRGKMYIDWRLGLSEAQGGWGQNYTVSLFREDSKACMEILKTFADVNGYPSMDITAALNDNTGEDFDVVMLRRMKVANNYLPKVEEWLNRQASFGKLYEELGDIHYDQLRPAAEKGYIALAESPQQFQGSFVNEYVFNNVKNELPGNIARYPISTEQKQQVEVVVPETAATQPVTSQAPAAGYKDVKEGSWYYEQLMQLSSRGILSGKGDGAFAPNEKVTRAQFAVALVKLLKYGERTPEGFTDVSYEDWYGPYVGAATQNGIVTGYGNGKFGPNDPVTREQAAVIIMKGYQSVLNKLPISGETQELTFKDKDQVSSWAVEYMKQASQSGFINGTGDNMVEPKKMLTRAEMAILLYNLLNSIRYDTTYQGDIQ